MNQSRDDRSRWRRRGGFTLVELLVAMTVTLILIFALAQAFAVVGESVAKGRASIEMTGNLRMVANRLQRDLQGITVPVRPVADDGVAPGYFEIMDGPSVDKDSDADGTNNVDPSTSDTTYGDWDDVLAFTTRNAEAPFFGTAYESASPHGVETYQSTLAEVVWWIQYQDSDNNGVRDAGETYLIYRRAMLIRPDLGYLPIRQLSRADAGSGPVVFTFSGSLTTINKNADGTITAVYPNSPPGYEELKIDLENFYNENDISVRLEWSVTASGLEVELCANSLADLTRRENRFAHKTILSLSPSVLVPATFPFPLQTNPNSVTCLYRSPKPPRVDLVGYDSVKETPNDNYGEDVVVSDALAFDVQVFDPQAPLLNWSTGDVLVPGDPGYFQGFSDSNGDGVLDSPPIPLPVNPNSHAFMPGKGAFVDLGYGIRGVFHENAANWSPFSGTPKAKSQLYVGTTPIYDYCTWSNYYERNGANEDGDSQTDEGMNGFDDNGSDGVDDIDEREALPPYPVPLRGIRVRIRTWDPDSRQIRQATVVSDFVPE